MFHKVRNLSFSAIALSVVVAALPSCKSGGSTSPTSPGNVVELNSGDIEAGGTYQHQFSAAGAYAYHCVHHVPMTGSVQVSSTATDTLANVSITSSTMSFSAASVKPGGRVVWTNNTGVPHTVTSN